MKRSISTLGNNSHSRIMVTSGKSAGIKDIAQALKVSIGTVDRALHGRPGVSQKTKARVLKMAEQMGYSPNLAAQALMLNRASFDCRHPSETYLAFFLIRCERAFARQPLRLWA